MTISELKAQLEALEAEGFGDVEVDSVYLAEIEEVVAEIEEAEEEEEEEEENETTLDELAAELAAQRAKWGY